MQTGSSRKEMQKESCGKSASCSCERSAEAQLRWPGGLEEERRLADIWSFLPLVGVQGNRPAPDQALSSCHVANWRTNHERPLRTLRRGSQRLCGIGAPTERVAGDTAGIARGSARRRALDVGAPLHFLPGCGRDGNRGRPCRRGSSRSTPSGAYPRFRPRRR